MRVTLTSTSKIVTIVVDGHEIPARIWEGETLNGVQCHAFITRIAAREGEDLDEFERELKEQRKPSWEVEAIPLRLIL